MAKLISPESLFSLLQSFTAVLDEFGVSHGRAKRAALCAGEGLLVVCLILILSGGYLNFSQAGPILKQYSPSNTTDIIEAIRTYNELTITQKWLVAPVTKIYSDVVPEQNAVEVCLCALITLSKFLKEPLASGYPVDHFTNPGSRRL